MELRFGHWEDERQPGDKGPHELLAIIAHGQRIIQYLENPICSGAGRRGVLDRSKSGGIRMVSSKVRLRARCICNYLSTTLFTLGLPLP